MPLTTRNIAKGIPPRLHEPKTTAKTANKGISKPKQVRKWVASDSKLDSDAEDPELVAKKSKDKKRRCVSAIGGPEVKIESIDKDAEPPERWIEEEDANGDGGQDDLEEVSKVFWAHTTTHSPSF